MRSGYYWCTVNHMVHSLCKVMGTMNQQQLNAIGDYLDNMTDAEFESLLRKSGFKFDKKDKSKQKLMEYLKKMFIKGMLGGNRCL